MKLLESEWHWIKNSIEQVASCKAIKAEVTSRRLHAKVYQCGTIIRVDVKLQVEDPGGRVDPE